MTWSYDTATNLRDAHALRIVEFYGNVEHEYYLDPTQLTVARPRLPGALAALYDGANVGKATAALFRLGDTPWAALRPTVNAAFRRLGRGEPAYAFDFRDSN